MHIRLSIYYICYEFLFDSLLKSSVLISLVGSSSSSYLLVSFGVLVKNRFSSVGVGTGFFPVTSGPESALISSSGLVRGFFGTVDLGFEPQCPCGRSYIFPS